jgi:hypothetical protein
MPRSGHIVWIECRTTTQTDKSCSAPKKCRHDLDRSNTPSGKCINEDSCPCLLMRLWERFTIRSDLHGCTHQLIWALNGGFSRLWSSSLGR